MAKTAIPVYDICSIDERAQKDLLIEPFGTYLEKHYKSLSLPHRHSFYHLVMFTEGKGSHTLDFKKFPVEPYGMYFMIPGQVHSWHFDGAVTGYIVHFNEVLFTSFFQNHRYLEQFSFFQGKAETGVCQLPHKVRDAVTSLFEALLVEMALAGPHYLDIIRCKLIELFITVDRACPAAVMEQVPDQKPTLLRSFQGLIDKHYRDLKLPKEYADLLFVTPNHLNAICQDLVGHTAGDLIRSRVLLEAKRLLTNARLTAAQIADELNFQDPSYFNRFFKKYEGVTPDVFRKTIVQQ